MAENPHSRYARAGFGSPVRRGRRPALVVVDFSRGFTDPASPIGADMTAQVNASARLISVLRQLGAPIVFTTIAFPAHVPNVWLDKAPGLAALRADSDAVQIDPRLPRESSDVVLTKTGASAFFGTDLATVLRAYGADTVLMCGATTSGCVRASAVDSVQYGFPTMIVSDCVADRDSSAHKASLFDIHAKYGDVVPLSEAEAYAVALSGDAWSATANTPSNSHFLEE